MNDGPKICTLDIETRPATLIGFDIWNQNFSVPQIIEPVKVLSFAAKWLGKPKVEFWSDQDGHDEMILHAWDWLDQADVLVTYNGDRFDIPHLNREFQLAGLGIPSPYKSVDLFKVAKRKFKFISNKLENITLELGLQGKLSHEGMTLWLGCMNDDPKSWATMKRYNIQDVRQTELVYLEFLPWIDNHPNYALFVDSDLPLCPRCGSSELQRRGTQIALTRQYQRYQCQGCGGWVRGIRCLPDGPTVRDTR